MRFLPVLLMALISIQVSGGDMTRPERDAMFEKYVSGLSNPNLNASFEQLAVAGGQMDHVVVLGGYSGQGYDNPAALREALKRVMIQNGSNTMYVIGSTTDGIGAGYNLIPELSKELGFTNVKTAGIVSRNAAQYGIFEGMDYNVFVDTDPKDWTVLDEKGSSYFVRFAKETGGELVYFRGGPISVSEMDEAAKAGVRVTLFRDADLAASSAVAAKKVAKANPDLSPDSAEFKAKVAEMLAAADKPTAEFAAARANDLTVVNSVQDFKPQAAVTIAEPAPAISAGTVDGACIDKALKGLL